MGGYKKMNTIESETSHKYISIRDIFVMVGYGGNN